MTREALTLGEFMLRATRWPVRSDHIATARRARAVLGDAQVLIVLRTKPTGLNPGTSKVSRAANILRSTIEPGLIAIRALRQSDCWRCSTMICSMKPIAMCLDHSRFRYAFISNIATSSKIWRQNVLD